MAKYLVLIHGGERQWAAVGGDVPLGRGVRPSAVERASGTGGASGAVADNHATDLGQVAW